MDDKALRALAEAATPGPWSHYQSGGIHQIDAATKTVVHWSGFDQLQTPNEKATIKDNAAYIAAANPAAILALLDRVKALEKGLSFYADPGDYKAPFTGGMGKLYFDCGQAARALLENKS